MPTATDAPDATTMHAVQVDGRRYSFSVTDVHTRGLDPRRAVGSRIAYATIRCDGLAPIVNAYCFLTAKGAWVYPSRRNDPSHAQSFLASEAVQELILPEIAARIGRDLPRKIRRWEVRAKDPSSTILRALVILHALHSLPPEQRDLLRKQLEESDLKRARFEARLGPVL